MTRKCVIGTTVTRRKADGVSGARLVVTTDHGGWQGRYSFDTHGLTDEEVQAGLTALDARHAALAARQDGFEAIRGSDIASGDDTYRVADCTLLERSGGRVMLYLDVVRIVDDVPVRLPAGGAFPIERVYSSVDTVPDDEAIGTMIVDALGAHEASRTADDGILTSLAQFVTE